MYYVREYTPTVDGDNLKYDEIVKEINVTVKHDNNCIQFYNGGT
jgi:hypothetical protein